MGYFRNIFQLELFQGDKRRPPYFEGWYFKLQSREGHTMAFIPGLSLGGGDQHSFIQFFDSLGGQMVYARYSPSDFRAADSRLEINVGKSIFSDAFIDADIDAGRRIKGKVFFTDPIPYSRRRLSPGIMGPFAFLPFLECRHGIVTVRCGLEGQMEIDGKAVSFDGGCGYAEKDWGSKFPNIYLWAQACRFEERGASFMLSLARVPVLGKKVKGLIAFLYDGVKIYRLSTYSGAKVLNIWQGEKGETSLIAASRTARLFLRFRPGKPCGLKAPDKTGMGREIFECLDGQIEIRLFEKGREVFSGLSDMAGLEICGPIAELAADSSS